LYLMDKINSLLEKNTHTYTQQYIQALLIPTNNSCTESLDNNCSVTNGC